MVRLLVFSIAVAVASLASAQCPGGRCDTCQDKCGPQAQGTPGVIWGQPGRFQAIVYPTPLRDLLFGTQRFIPQGPPVPYMLVPGQFVFPRLVPPQIAYPPMQEPRP